MFCPYLYGHDINQFKYAGGTQHKDAILPVSNFPL